MSLHGNRGQLQAGNPAFGARFQGGDVFRREVEAHHLVEKSGGFGGGKAQVGGAQLGQLAAGAQPGQGQLGILTGGDDQVHLRRQVLEQKGEGLVNRFGIRSGGSKKKSKYILKVNYKVKKKKKKNPLVKIEGVIM